MTDVLSVPIEAAGNHASDVFDELDNNNPADNNDAAVDTATAASSKEGGKGEESLFRDSVNGERIKRRAKRPSRIATTTNSRADLTRTNSDSQVIIPLRSLKNSRKSRSAFGRGLPKKGGAGGKGVWGALGSELEEAEVETADPNFDDDSLDNKDITLKVIHVEPTDEELMKQISVAVCEYFDHGSTEEVYCWLTETRIPARRGHVLLQAAVEQAVDHKPSHREMCSVLLADLYGHFLSEESYTQGFGYLITNLPDLTLDAPDAPTILGNFIARAIADDCIPPKFLQGYKGKAESDEAVRALSRAENLLSMRHGLVRLDGVWGVGGGTRPVKYLIKQMVLLLEEYLSSSDIKEATRCLLELEVPHFHHELVYEAVIITLEKMDDRTMKLMAQLLGELNNTGVVTPRQMSAGFLRVYEEMPEICVDVPPAYSVLERFVTRCRQGGVVGDDVVKKLPIRGRKRFVSEGDGGRIKSDSYF